MAAPIQTITNTSANSGPPSFMSSAVPCNIVAMNVQRIRGPHKSPRVEKIGVGNTEKVSLRSTYILSIAYSSLLGKERGRI